MILCKDKNQDKKITYTPHAWFGYFSSLLMRYILGFEWYQAILKWKSEMEKVKLRNIEGSFMSTDIVIQILRLF